MPPVAVWINALIIASTIVLMASGLVLVFSIMGILNWSHGQLYMVGGFIVYYVVAKLGMNYFIALFAATVIAAGLGVVIEKWLLRPLSDRGFLPASVVGLGLIFVFEGAVTILFGTGIKSVPTILEGSLHVGQVSLSVEKMALAGLAIVVMLGLYLFICHTRIGLAIRAAAQEPDVAGMYGVSSGRLFSLVMAIGCGLAALAGGMIAPVYFVDPWMGAKPLITALLAIVLGGLGSFRGAVVGGIFLGFVMSVVAYYISSWYELVAFLAVILIILFRPQGLFGISEARV